METSPNTDKTVQVKKSYSKEKFRDIRSKAKEVEEVSYKKRNKNKREKIPEYKIGQKVIISTGMQKRDYCYVEVIDFMEKHDSFSYFCIIEKTTDRKLLDRIGRLFLFDERNSFFSSYWSPAKVSSEKGIRWIEI